MSRSTAILFFTLTPENEYIHKTVHSNHKINGRLLRGLYNHTRSILRRQSLPVIEINEDGQKGVGFGERLAYAAKEVFDLGYDQIIILGNDCPSLSLNDIQKAKKSLRSGQQVIGQSCDGGAYLIGLSKLLFREEDFISLPWTTPHLGLALQEYLLEKGELVQLRPKADIDDQESLKYLIARFHFFSIIRILKNLLTIQIKQVVCKPFFRFTFFYWACFFRGPPVKDSNLF